MHELVVTVGLIFVIAAMAIPATFGAVDTYRLNSAVTSAAWAIQAARYQAIMKGYSFRLAFDHSNNTYQLSSQVPPAASFSNVGGAVPVSGSPIALSADTTLQFRPNGSVSATTGAMNFTISYRGRSKTVTVSTYGSVSVQ